MLRGQTRIVTGVSGTPLDIRMLEAVLKECRITRLTMTADLAPVAPDGEPMVVSLECGPGELRFEAGTEIDSSVVLPPGAIGVIPPVWARPVIWMKILPDSRPGTAATLRHGERPGSSADRATAS